MRNVQRQRRTKISASRIARPIAASFKMHEIEEGANTSTNASPRPSCLTPDRQALAGDSMMESITASGSRLRRGDPITASVSKLRRGDPPTIYKVPQTIRQLNKVAYKPQIVSIGPYHHGKKKLQAMEEHKRHYQDSLLSRNTDYKLEHYLKEIEELEDKARSCYSEKVCQGNEFVKMMVLDACFIVEFFLRASTFFPDDRIFCTRWMPILIGYDLLLLENQIPFIVLQRIVKIVYPDKEPDKEPDFLAERALDFFNQFMPMNKNIEIKDSYYHLLHLFHSHLIPTPTDGKEEHNLSCNPIIKYVLNKSKNLLVIFLPRSNKALLPITERREMIRQMIPCATDLQLVGVQFKKNKESNSILNVKFSNGVLEIPLLLMRDYSESLFRNLLAFEQCCPEANDHFTTYLVFMDYLVQTSEDVALLHHNGIIDNYLGSDDDVVHLFNRLFTGIFHDFKGTYLEGLHHNVQKHCKNKWRTWLANLLRDYFNDPWSGLLLVQASIILALTITQTFYTVLTYYDRGSSS